MATRPKQPEPKVAPPAKNPPRKSSVADKRPQEGPSPQEEHEIALANGLAPTDVPGVYLSRSNVRVNYQGVWVDFINLKTADRVYRGAVIDGDVDSPAKFLKSVALDPTQPLLLRIDAAKAAAPYFDRKTPIAVDGGADAAGVAQPLNMSVLAAMPTAELKAALALLTKLGVPV